MATDGQDAGSFVSDEDDVSSHIWATFAAGGLVASCAWCGRMRIDDIWLVPPPTALAAIDAPNTLTHSICDDCAQTASTPRAPSTYPGQH
jgi:hypothetical protein